MHYFPYTNELAYYNPLGQYIYMARYGKEEFAQFAEVGITLETLSHWSVYFHEYRHWLDHIGTIWGQDFLIDQHRRMLNHLNGKNDNASLLSPFLLSELFEKKNLPQVSQKVKPKNEHDYWQWSPRTLVIDNLPVFILDFKDRHGKLVCSTPVTHISLFEANALYEELHLSHHARRELISDKIVQRIEVMDEQWRYFEQSYDSEFIDYSAAMHITSAVLNTSHYFEAFKIASIISTVVLNIPPHHLERIELSSHSYERHHHHLIINRDLGYLVFAMSMNYQSKYKETGHFDLSDFLSASGLPSVEILEKEVIEVMESNLTSMSGKNVIAWQFRRQIEYGIDVFSKRGFDGKGKMLLGYFFDGEIRPDIVFGDELWDSQSLEALLKLPRPQFGLHEWYDLVGCFEKIDGSLKRFTP